MDDDGYVHKKASSEILFAEYGRNYSDDEEPTKENRRVIDLYDPVDAMSLNREKDRLVVAGIRGVLQIVKIQNSPNDVIEGPSLVKDLDMRAYRKGKVNILYSAQNVKWNQIYDQYIATTSSNGSIVCWNITRRNKSVYKAHERSATCVDWHAKAPYILISGSRDCTVKSYDLRAKDVHQLTFSDRNCEAVRDVAMCKAPGFDDYFFTGDDGGVLRLWDLRQTKKWVFQKVAHRSFVSTICLNPNNRMLIASGGGRDKMVKIWEWTGPELKRLSVVETTAPLGRVVWRPDKPWHLATCASVNETAVHVWDVRRPYLPYVTYDEHRDSVTDACWPSSDFDVFLSCGKDGLVVLHNIDSGHAPINYACDVAFDITPDGVIGIAVNSEIHAKNDAELEALTATPAGKKTARKTDTFDLPVKSLVSFGVPESLTHSLPPTKFYQIAEKYLIGGMEIAQLCELNSKVARKAGHEHVAQTWRLVEALCAQAKIQEEYDKYNADEKERIIRAWIVRKKELAEEGRRWLANLDELCLDDVKKQVTERLENTQHVTAFLNFSSSSDSDGNSDKDMEGIIENRNMNEADRRTPEKENEKGEDGQKKKKKKRKNVTFTDFYFGAGESNFKNAGGKKEMLHLNEFMGLRNEAYELRDEAKESRFFCKARKQPTNAEEFERELRETEADYQAWSPMLEIYRLLLYHAEQGDMQTCATVSMVCGKRLFDAVDPYTVNGWIQCYMEMLDRLELFLVCAKIRKYCPLESISSVSRENTTIQLAHSDCDALIVNGRCTKCEEPAQPDCTICRFAIVGMTFQCNVCGHAMHTDHAYEWFQKSNECAFVGCPCTCGQNTWPDMERTFIGNDDVSRRHRKFDKHAPEPPPNPNGRVDASRLDTDSEESPEEECTEWTPMNNIVREKLGITDNIEWQKPWAQHLSQLYHERYRSDAEDEEEEEPEVEEEDSEEEALKVSEEKRLNKELLREAVGDEAKKLRKELAQDMESSESETKDALDKQDYTFNYLYDPSDDDVEEYLDEEEGVIIRVRPYYDNLEYIYDIQPVENEFYGENEEMIADEEMPEPMFSDEYIASIGPIGLESYLAMMAEEAERVTSPTVLNGRDELTGMHMRKKEVVEVEDIDQMKYMSYKDKALAVLSMTKKELKKIRARRRRKREEKRDISTSYQVVEESDDEFEVSSASTDESSTSLCTSSGSVSERFESSNEELAAETEIKERDEMSPKVVDEPLDRHESSRIVFKTKKFSKTRTVGSDSDDCLFSDDEDYSSSEFFDDSEEFFPCSSSRPIELPPRMKHPWETEEQYMERIRKEPEELGNGKLFNLPPVKQTPMMRELKKIKTKVKVREELLKQLPERLPKKRVTFADQFTVKNTSRNEVSEDEEEEENNRSDERCTVCYEEVRDDRKDRTHAHWVKRMINEGQLFFAKSLTDHCSSFQLNHLDGSNSEIEDIKREGLLFIEFVKLFYFIDWNSMLRPDTEKMIKEIYELWDEYRKARPRVCTTHHRDFQFRFFASSIAIKIKKKMYENESLATKQRAMTYEWLHLKPCVVTLEDDPTVIDGIFEQPKSAVDNPEWTTAERNAAGEYWQLFGNVPLHIQSVVKTGDAPAADDALEIIDETNYWTRKMLKHAAYQSRNYDIRLSYTRRRKEDELRRQSTRRWQNRINGMVNERRPLHFRPDRPAVHTDDDRVPFPVCQIDDGTHIVTIRPLVTKKFIEIKSRVRSKFGRGKRGFTSQKRLRDVVITRDDIRKTQSFRRFEPKLKRAEELQKLVSKHFKVIERFHVERKYELYPIIEEEDEVSLIVKMLENRTGKDRLDAEKIFAERREQREKKELETWASQEEAKYRRELENEERLEAEKMSIMKKHWTPRLRKTLTTARKVIELGRIMVEEDIQKWMEYQYELSFVQKNMRQARRITKQEMLDNLPSKWRDTIINTDVDSIVSVPYVSRRQVDDEDKSKELASPASPILPSYNSSSGDESDEEEVEPEEDANEEIETPSTCVDLVRVAERLQSEVEQRQALLESEDEHSNDSSVSDWFERDTDDIVNRLVNENYVDEHRLLKERARGALASRLCWVEEQSSEESTDEEESVTLDRIRQKTEKNEKTLEAEWMVQHADEYDVGVSDGVRTKELAAMEAAHDQRVLDRRALRRAEVEQCRGFLKQYALEHSHKSEPFDWDPAFCEPLAGLHRCELRRVGRRIHRKMKEDYEIMAERDEIVAEIVPANENSGEFQMIDFLMFNSDCRKRSAKSVAETKEILKPIKMYEMFFGKEGVCKLQLIEAEMKTFKNLRNSMMYLQKHLGAPVQQEPFRRFVKMWWYTSRQSLNNFIACYDGTLSVEEAVCDSFDFLDEMVEMGENFERIRQFADELEVLSLVNELAYVVDQYVEETRSMFFECTDEVLRQQIAALDVFEWQDFKYGVDEEMFSETTTESSDEYDPEDLIRKPMRLSKTTRRKPKRKYVKRCVREWNRMKAKQAERRAKTLVQKWTRQEKMKLWREDDEERKLHDYLKMQAEDPFACDEELVGVVSDAGNGVFVRGDTSRYDFLETCGLPVTLDHQLFPLQVDECQSGDNSVSDADEIQALIEVPTAYTNEVEDDAQSYDSTRHVLRHELYFQRDVDGRRVPTCVVLFEPKVFFEPEHTDREFEYVKWRRIIEASDSPYSFNRLVMRERMLAMCRDAFRNKIVDKYFEEHERETCDILEVFNNLMVLVVVDTNMEPWVCRIVSPDDFSHPAHDRVSYIRKRMIQDSQENLQEWLETQRIDLEVFSMCTVIVARDEELSVQHADEMTDVFMEEDVLDEWLIITKREGVKALDAMIRMPRTADDKLPIYKSIFKPIYDAWYPTWKFENSTPERPTLVVRRFDPAKEYIHKARMIVNYAHQHYRMKRFDSLMSKDPTEFQLMDRSDVPSASLFDSLDAAVSKFCYEDSPHLEEADRLMVKDTLIQLATGKIPHFTTNYFGAYDYTESSGPLGQEDEENDDDKSPLVTRAEFNQPVSPNAKPFELEEVDEEMQWLRSMFEESDVHRRRWMAVLLFEMAQKAMFRFAPNLADFKRAQEKFNHLLTLHGKQRPLLDMMLTRVRGTYFMPLETNLFLYDSKLITFGELVDSERHPRDWANKRESLRKNRRQAPKDPLQMSEFLEKHSIGTDSDSGTEIRSDPSSSLGSMESLNSSKRGKRARKTMGRAQREMMLLKLRSKPADPDATFAAEKRALGPKMWKTRRRLNDLLEGIADLDRNKLEAKLPGKKQELLSYVNDLIVNNADTAHWSWGDLQMETRIGRIPPVHRMRPKHVARIEKGLKTYQPPEKYDPTDRRTNGRKWF